ncbi:MAG TPA: tRNA (adenosine(37)-N6)-threonylcarbamoyltransferase complex ATPase subunit type 1 TsaE [Deltaproteobacteria bacterium]|jgi:tRNA threonylcarbamoyladenosine biosynthesis protein TsaE|nr:tRNA (adenosine(37)-N6)-threonylcarbamoyltransferase complex ATPase subunit type 1 TsaE [Deltaproteobacteria bacterium]HRT46143.1 tRNA (adenosine(37)-N6)-threonylcarbamoyltransferase complex ATPase subunit type 1 TsaE [Desulfomonilia bacterium]
MEIFKCTTSSPEQTFELGRKLGGKLIGGEIILLHGDLGAGKTLFTKGIARGLGIEDTSTVVSPSFTLVNIYKARLDIVHGDLYRLDSDAVYELGLEDYMDREHVMVIEWAEKANDFFTGNILDITIERAGETARNITLLSPHAYLDPGCSGSFSR